MPQFILCDCCGKRVEDFESRLEYFKHLQIAEKCKNCEQVVEAAHAKFDKVWQRYKVNDLERDSHGEKLRNCVVDFNTKNL